jgi:hypothetical protein
MFTPPAVPIAPPAMPIDRLPNYQRLTLRAILLIQIAHTLILLNVDALYRLIEPLPAPHPWWQNINWDGLHWACMALPIEIIIWRSLSRLKNCAWPYISIVLITAFLYLGWTVHFSSVLGRINLWGICMLAPFPFGFTVLWLSRRAFSVRPSQLIQVALATILAVVLIYIKGLYLPMTFRNWEVASLPRYVDIIYSASSGDTVQETRLLLFWLCYAILGGILAGIRRIRSWIAL